jgi:hypothetical protein
MKSNTKTYAIWAGLMLCTAVGALAVPVTFTVNMEYQMTNAAPTFTPPGDTVEVKSSINGFGAGFAMANVPGTYLYTNTIEITGAAGSTSTYKFHTYGTHDVWENFPGGSYVNDGNRAFVVPGSPQTLPTYYFNNIWGGTTLLTVQVDMQAEILAGAFTPSPTDPVELKGAFNNWGAGYTLTNDTTGISSPTNIYSQTFSMGYPAPGGVASYKFHAYGSHDLWESDPNRFLEMTNPATVMPVVCFNRACSIPVKVALYMQVDMNSQILIGSFDPTTTYQLWADGDNLGGWGDPPQGMRMFEDTTRPGIFTNYWSGLLSPGATFPFKFKIWNTANSGTTWESLYDNTNRTVVWTGTETVDANGNHLITYGPVLFSNFQANTNDYLPAATWVTFKVDMTGAVGVSNTTPDEVITWDGSQSVYINGPFVGYGGVKSAWWNWATTSVDGGPSAWQLTNNPVLSQTYSLEVLLPKGSPVRVQYKYSINGWDNGGGVGVDRFRDVRSLAITDVPAANLPNYPFPQDTFATQWIELQYDPYDFGRLVIGAPDSGKVPVQWSGRPGVHLQTATDLGGAWSNLNNTDGTTWTNGVFGADGLTSITNYPTAAGATYFRLIKPGS